MTRFERLMQLPGVLAAFEFSDRGELIEHQIDQGQAPHLDDRILDLLAHVCVANRAIGTMQARGWETLTQMQGFYPVTGFSLIGSDWSVVIQDRTGLVLRNDQGDLEAAFAGLTDSPRDE